MRKSLGVFQCKSNIKGPRVCLRALERERPRISACVRKKERDG